MLNLDFHSNKVIFLLSTLIFFTLPSQNSFSDDFLGLDWEDKEISLDEIKNPLELEKIIKREATSEKFLYLEAEYDDNRIKLKGKKLRVIREIKYNVINTTFIPQLTMIKNKYVGYSDHPQIKELIKNEIIQVLKQHGYLNPTVELTSVKYGDISVYDIIVRGNKPCLIHQLHYTFKRNKDFFIEISKGDICNEITIKKSIAKANEDLRNKGYYRSVIALNKIEYHRKKNHADIYLSGVLGQKETHKIIETTKSGLIGSFFSEDPFEDINFEYANNESIKSSIIDFYKERGFDDVVIESVEQQEISSGGVKYLYKLSPGVRYIIEKVVFEGNSSLKTQALLNKLAELNIIPQESYYNPNIIDNLVEEISSLYSEEGFWYASVYRLSLRKNQEKETVDVVIKVVEDNRSLLKQINFSGISYFSRKDFESFITVKTGQSLNKNFISNIENSILSKYRDSGFLKAKVQISIVYEKAKYSKDLLVTININVVEGLRFKIRKIIITGLEYTKVEVVKQALTFKEGDWYDPLDIEETRKKILGLGVFKTVRMLRKSKANLEESIEELELTIVLQEGLFGFLTFAPGFNIQRGFNFSSEVRYANVLGMAHRFRLKAYVSQEKKQHAIYEEKAKVVDTFIGRRFDASYIDPYLFGYPLIGSISLNHTGTSDSIWKITNFIELAVKYSLNRFISNSSVKIFYNFKTSEDEGTISQEKVLVATGPSKISSLGLRYYLDTRKRKSWPSSGIVFEPEISFASSALGGEYDYIQWSFLYNQFIGIIDDLVIAFSFSHKAYDNITRRSSSLENSILPSSERLFVGGSDGVRGYRETLGPYVRFENGPDIIGGSKKTIAKMELRYLLVKDIFGLGLFIDAGNSFFSEKEVNKFNKKFSGLGGTATLEDNFPYSLKKVFTDPSVFWKRSYSSYGLSMKLLSPLGSINVAFSFPWHEPVNSLYQRKKTGDSLLSRMVVVFDVSTRF